MTSVKLCESHPVRTCVQVVADSSATFFDRQDRVVFSMRNAFMLAGAPTSIRKRSQLNSGHAGAVFVRSKLQLMGSGSEFCDSFAADVETLLLHEGYCPAGGCQSSILLPSGSMTHPNFPYSESSVVFSSTSQPSSRSA